MCVREREREEEEEREGEKDSEGEGGREISSCGLFAKISQIKFLRMFWTFG